MPFLWQCLGVTGERADPAQRLARVGARLVEDLEDARHDAQVTGPLARWRGRDVGEYVQVPAGGQGGARNCARRGADKDARSGQVRARMA
ncbi:hypothetical protein [Actinomadura sp. 9N407]|uniref:hypothetical protein n=1 Tax=Actinomadura sp. 9N407 TaxID=3375154 RepID=UPI0037B2ADC1